MYKELNQISNLLALLDDTDLEIYQTVRTEIIKTGTLALPHLYEQLQTTTDKELIFRIQELIRTLETEPILEQLSHWASVQKPDLLEGMLLLNKLVDHTNLEEDKVIKEFEEIQKIIWVELNNYLTPLEKINVISHVLFKIKKITAQIVDFAKPEEFLVNTLLLEQKGNNFSVSILYMALCQIFDLKVHAVKFPKHIILGYCDTSKPNAIKNDNNFFNMTFYIDPSFGNILSHENISTYFNRIGEALDPQYFTFLSNQELLGHLVKKLARSYFDEQKELLLKLAASLTSQ